MATVGVEGFWWKLHWQWQTETDRLTTRQTNKQKQMIQQGLTSPPTQYRLSGRQFYRSKDPANSIKVLKEKRDKNKETQKKANDTKYSNTIKRHTYTASPLVYTNMGWLGDGSHRGQGRQARTEVGLPPRYPLPPRNKQWTLDRQTDRQTYPANSVVSMCVCIRMCSTVGDRVPIWRRNKLLNICATSLRPFAQQVTSVTSQLHQSGDP